MHSAGEDQLDATAFGETDEQVITPDATVLYPKHCFIVAISVVSSVLLTRCLDLYNLYYVNVFRAF